MTAQLGEQSYGKSRVRVSRITRGADRQEIQELTVDLSLDGDFSAAYTHGDNSAVIPTDTMKNTVYALAQQHGIGSIETFAGRLAKHFLDRFSHVGSAVVHIEERPWSRIVIDGNEHPHSFVSAGSEVWCCETRITRNETHLQSGLKGLQVLKTTGSGFSKFLKDGFTTLKETDDRIFATTIEGEWPCVNLAADWPAARRAIRAALLKVFAENFSSSVQATLYQMATAAFSSCPLIDEISFTMPHQHHLPINFGPLGLAGDNSIFVPTDEPHGLIRATVKRGER